MASMLSVGRKASATVLHIRNIASILRMRFACAFRRLDTEGMNIGYTISKLREARAWSQDELAFRANTTAASISRIENNKQDATSDLIGKIASAFEMHAYQLVALAEGLEPEVHRRPDDTEVYRLIEGFRKLDKHKRAVLLQLSEWLAV